MLRFAPDAVIRYRQRSAPRELAEQFYGWGVTDVQLYRDFRDRGLTRPSVLDGVRGWAHLVARLPDLRRAGKQRTLWFTDLFRQWGHIRGSVRWRVLYL
jgi:hypothetical protein